MIHFGNTKCSFAAEKESKEGQLVSAASTDIFYSKSNIAHLQRGISALDAGKGIEHEIIEIEEQ